MARSFGTLIEDLSDLGATQMTDYSVYLWERWTAGLGMTFMLPVLMPLIWPTLPRWGKLVVYIGVVLIGTLWLVGLLTQSPRSDARDIGNAVALALLSGPLIAWALRRSYQIARTRLSGDKETVPPRFPRRAIRLSHAASAGN